MFQLVKSIPILFTLATISSVLIHDTHIDRATVAAATLPTALVAAGTMDYLMKANHHTHVDRISFSKNPSAQRSPLPKTQPPRDREDEKQEVQQRKLAYSGGDNTSSIWPSV